MEIDCENSLSDRKFTKEKSFAAIDCSIVDMDYIVKLIEMFLMWTFSQLYLLWTNHGVFIVLSYINPVEIPDMEENTANTWFNIWKCL